MRRVVVALYERALVDQWWSIIERGQTWGVADNKASGNQWRNINLLIAVNIRVVAAINNNFQITDLSYYLPPVIGKFLY